jgi:hypothetical protein
MIMIRAKRASRTRRSGVALIYALVASVAVAGMCMALLAMNLGTSKQRVQVQGQQRSFHAAEAGLSDAFMQVDEGLIELPENEAVSVGSSDAPVAFGDASYWVDIARIDTRSYGLTSNGRDGAMRERLQLVLSAQASGFFQWSAYGAAGVVLDSNSFIDSYDSALGSYVDQVQGGNEFALENGHVGSNADILLGSNTEIHGDARPGATGIVDDSRPGAYVSGTTDPSDEPFEMPPIDVPVIPSSGTIPGTANITVGPGEIHYDRITMNGGTTITVIGPATLVVDDLLMKANSTIVFDAAAGPIEVHGTGDFELLSNSTVVSMADTALGVTLLLSGNNQSGSPPDRIDLAANAEFIGAIYAPNAEFSLGSNFNIFGSIICDFLDLSSNGMIHFDEALLYDGWGASDDYEPSLWRRLPPE